MKMSKSRRSVLLQGNYYERVYNNGANGNGTATKANDIISSTKLPGAVLTGIVVGSVLLLILVLFIVICLISKCRKRRKKHKIKSIANKTKKVLNDRERLVREENNIADTNISEQVVTKVAERKKVEDGRLENNGQVTGTATEREREANEIISGMPDLLTHSSTNKPTMASGTRNLTSRPIKSSRVSPSQLYVPNSDSK